MKNPLISFHFLMVLMLAILLAACSLTTTPAPANTPAASTATVEPVAATETPAPTPTFTASPGKVFIVVPDGSSSRIADQVKAVVTELAGQSGQVVEERAALQASDLTPEVRVVVAVSPSPDLPALAAGAPNTQFVSLAPVSGQAAPNLSYILTRPEYQAFVAGFIAEVITTDWRAAGLLPSDGPLGESLQDAFTNGGQYFCGVCAPGWPLGEYYPQVAALPAASSGADWQAAAAGLFDTKVVDVFFLSAEAAKPEVFNSLAGKDQYGVGVRLLGVEAPPPEFQAQWVATVTYDVEPALRQLWPDLTAGKGGATVDAALVLQDVNEDNLGVGKLRLVEELMEEMKAGRIHPFTVPAE